MSDITENATAYLLVGDVKTCKRCLFDDIEMDAWNGDISSESDSLRMRKIKVISRKDFSGEETCGRCGRKIEQEDRVV